MSEFGDLRATNPPSPDPRKDAAERPACLAWSPAGDRVVFIPNSTTGEGKEVHWTAVVTSFGSPSWAVLPHGTAPVTAVAWSPDGKTVASGCRLGDVVLWDAKTYKELRRIQLGGRGRDRWIRTLVFAPDSQTLAAAVSFDEGKNAERVVMLDPTTGERRGNDLQGFGSLTPVALAFAPDGRTLAVGLADFLPQVQLPPGGEPRPLGSVVLFTTDPER
ncbi:MAG: hypothetical protein U0804_18730 [Gemmataceae bacterium]